MSEPTPAECLGPGYCMEHEELPTSHHPDCPLFSPAQPPAAAEPAERGEPCSTCGGSQTVHYGAEDKWQSLPCPNCSPEAKPPAQPPASGEPPELPADWMDAVDIAIEDSPLCTCSHTIGAHSPGCPAEPDKRAPITVAVLSAVAPLVLAERLRAERLRYALEQLLNAYATATSRDDTGHPVDPRYAWGKVALTAAPPSPDDDALAELLGLPGEWEERSNDHAREALGKQFEFRAYEDQAAQHWDQAADELRATLDKLGLPAGGEAGDG